MSYAVVLSLVVELSPLNDLGPGPSPLHRHVCAIAVFQLPLRTPLTTFTVEGSLLSTDYQVPHNPRVLVSEGANSLHEIALPRFPLSLQHAKLGQKCLLCALAMN